MHAGIVDRGDIPAEVAEVCGRTRREQLRTFVRAVIRAVDRYGEVGMDPAEASALAALRAFNYERIYVRPASLAQSRAVVEVLRALVEFYVEHPEAMPATRAVRGAVADPVRAAVAYVAGMTDRYAFDRAVTSWAGTPPACHPATSSQHPAVTRPVETIAAEAPSNRHGSPFAGLCRRLKGSSRCPRV